MRLSRLGCISVLSVGSLLIGSVLASGGCNESSSDNSTEDMAPGTPTVVNPTITSVTPNQASVKGGQQIQIVGTGFAAGTTVKLGGVAATNVNVQSRTLLSATTPVYAGNIGPVELLIENPDGGKASRSDLFTFVRVQVAFADTITRASGGAPVAIVAEDINSDGKRDLLVANSADNNVAVLLSNQDFMQVTAPYATPVLPTSIAVADINGDVYKDIVVSCSNANSEDVAVLRGVGNGAFMPPDKFAVGMNANGVVTKDFNGDGKVDIAVTVRPVNKVFVMLNNLSTGATPSFAMPYASYSVGAGPSALVLADVNSDGRTDLVSGNYDDGQIGVLFGMTDGTFQTPALNTSVQTNPFGLATGDLNGDGKIDVLATNFGSNTMSLLSGKGDGSFTSSPAIQTADKPTGVAIADLDGDGKQDVVLANSGGNQIWVLLGKGDGTFEPTQYFLVGQQPWAIAVADFDGDGKPDVATANRASNNVSILFNKTVR